jgi:2-polyprenyl-3-methyl-5-hydroxy-6-metoxy-1,4-benzoquinol methylase
MIEDLVKKAIDPYQYDSKKLNWSNTEYGINTPNRKWIYSYLKNYTSKINNKRIIDIGCGTGWLVNELSQSNYAIGIDPSKNNINKGKKLYPNCNLINNDLESFCIDCNETFNNAFSIMSFIHFINLDKAFSYTSKICKNNFILITPDYEHFKRRRDNVKIVGLNNKEYVIEIKRPNGTVVDIVRKNSCYIESAKKFNLTEHINMKPNEELINSYPKYERYKDQNILHMFIFEKK